MVIDAQTAAPRTPQSADDAVPATWVTAHSRFLRVVLVIFAYCSAVISMISVIAFRGVNAVAVVAGVLCILAGVGTFLLRGSRWSASVPRNRAV